MSDEIIKILDDLGERFGLAIDWTSENVIPMLEVLYDKFINYSIIMTSINLGLGVVLITLMILMAHWLSKDYTKCATSESNTLLWEYKTRTIWRETTTEVEETVLGFVLTIGSGIMFIVGILLIVFNIGDLIELLTIPELYVFEYLKPYVLGE